MTQTLSQLADDLWPHLNLKLDSRLAGLDGSSSSSSTLSLSPSDYPDAILRDGSRPLLGDLPVAAGKKVDGVDISDFYDSYVAHLSTDAHSIYVEKNSADTITAVHTFSPSIATAPFILDTNAQNQLVTGLRADSVNKGVTAGTGLTGGGTLTSNITLNVGAGAGLVGNADDIAVGAGTGITANADDVAVDQAFSPTWTGTHQFNSTANVSSLIPRTTDTYDLGSSTKLYRKGYLSQMEALLFVENSISVIGGWFYITKDQGTLAADVSAADTTIDFGKAMTVNDFVVMRTSLKLEYVKVLSLSSGTRYNVTRNLESDVSGPETWVQGTVFAVLGNTGNGRIELNASDTPRMQVLQQGATYDAQIELIRVGDLNGNWGYGSETYGAAFGEYASGKANITIDPVNGIRLRSYTTDKITLDTSGNASIAGSFTIGTSGGIYQGSGTFASPTTGLKLYNSGGAGVLAGYSGGSVQAQFNTSGQIEAGAGAVFLDSNGIAIVPGTVRSDVTSYKFASGGTNFSELNGTIGVNTHGITLSALSLSGRSSNAIVQATAQTAGRTANVTIRAVHGSNSPQISFDATSTAGSITISGALTHADGMSLGAASFPSSPATDMLFYRTDRALWYYYDGTRWLTTNVYSATVAETTFSGTGAAPMISLRTDYAPYITRIKVSTNIATTHNSTDRWSLTFRGYNATRTTATNLNADLNSWTINATTSTWGGHEFVPTTPNPVNYDNLMIGATKNASAGNLIMSATMYYRLIG